MTRNELEEVMDKVFEECRGLRQAGQKEYAHDTENAMANFERIGAELNMSREQILWVFARKHIDGIVAHINGHKSQRESVFGRINDLIVYLILYRGMVEEDISNEKILVMGTEGGTDTVYMTQKEMEDEIKAGRISLTEG